MNVWQFKRLNVASEVTWPGVWTRSQAVLLGFQCVYVEEIRLSSLLLWCWNNDNQNSYASFIITIWSWKSRKFSTESCFCAAVEGQDHCLLRQHICIEGVCNHDEQADDLWWHATCRENSCAFQVQAQFWCEQFLHNAFTCTPVRYRELCDGQICNTSIYEQDKYRKVVLTAHISCVALDALCSHCMMTIVKCLNFSQNNTTIEAKII